MKFIELLLKEERRLTDRIERYERLSARLQRVNQSLSEELSHVRALVKARQSRLKPADDADPPEAEGGGERGHEEEGDEEGPDFNELGLRESVRWIIRNYEGPMDAGEIASILEEGGFTRKDAKTTLKFAVGGELSRMARDGQIRRVDRGEYAEQKAE